MSPYGNTRTLWVTEAALGTGTASNLFVENLLSVTDLCVCEALVES